MPYALPSAFRFAGNAVEIGSPVRWAEELSLPVSQR
jgi:hypothetical protein